MASADRPVRTILVVEDDPGAREGMAAVLARAGYGVVAAEDGGEALQRLAAGFAPDLILLDMLMPVLDGWHFLGQLKRFRQSPPVVVTTGTVLTREWATDHGCAGFLHKPIAPEDLLAEVRQVLGESGP